jgi:hypothetical protein
MRHESWCDVPFHRVNDDDVSRLQDPCTGPHKSAGPISAWLVATEAGTMVDIAHTAGVPIPVQQAAQFADQLKQLAVQGGAVLPEPRPSS